MNRNLIGVGTSVSKDKGYDPVDTLTFAAENNIKTVQVYLNNDLISNPPLIKKISNYAKEKELQLTCHSPESLNKLVLSSDLIYAAKELLIYQTENKFIVHFDENEKLDRCIDYINELYQNDLVVCLENYHLRKDAKKVAQSIQTFNAILTRGAEQNLPIYPVIDFPRLFISGIVENINALLIIKQVLDNVSMLSKKVILHLIDFSHYDQGRDTWCAIGKGLMPYQAIFNFINEINLHIDHCVLEYEDKKLFLQSIEAVTMLLAGGQEDNSV